MKPKYLKKESKDAHHPLAALLLLLAACSPTPDDAPPFPRAWVDAAFDLPTAQATQHLRTLWTDAQVEQRPFLRATTQTHPWLEEAFLFQDVRSGRTHTVILKYKNQLSDAQRRAVLDDAHAPDPQGDVAAAPYAPGRTLRARSRDRQGRLTLTVEATPPVNP